MKAKRIAFPESLYPDGTGIEIDRVAVAAFEVVLVAGLRFGHVAVRAFDRDPATGQVRVRHVVTLRGRRQLLELARAILRRDEADQRRDAAVRRRRAQHPPRLVRP